jgi:hypothetical protein
MTDPDQLDIMDSDRLDIVEALEAAGWIGDDDNPLGLLRKNGATYGVHGECGDSSLTGPGGWTVEFPSDMPTVVVVATCVAAANQQRTPRPELRSR